MSERNQNIEAIDTHSDEKKTATNTENSGKQSSTRNQNYEGLAPRIKQLNKKMQKCQEEATTLLEQASQYAHNNVEKAYELYKDAGEKENECHAIWEEIDQMARPFYESEGPLSAIYEEIKQSRQLEEAMSLNSMGMLVLQMGKLDDAQAAFNQALVLVEDEDIYLKAPSLESQVEFQNEMIKAFHTVKASSLIELGIIHQMKDKFKKAEHYFDTAFEECIEHEIWDRAAQALSFKAACALVQGDRAGFLRSIDEAIDFAQSHGLSKLEMSMREIKTSHLMEWDATGEDEKTVSEEFSQVEEQLKSISEIDRDKPNEKLIDYLLLDSQFKLEVGAAMAAKRRLHKALNLAQASKYKQCSIYLQLAKVCEVQKAIDEGITYAENALRIAKEVGIRDMIHTALQTLIYLQLETEDTEQHKKAMDNVDSIINQLHVGESHENLAHVLLQRALLKFKVQSLETALADIEKAEKLAVTPELCRCILVPKSITLWKMGRREEALEASVQAIDLLTKQFPSTSDSLPTWRYVLDQIEPLYEGAALLAAELGRVKEALEYAENGKAWLLRHQLIRTESAIDKQQQKFWGSFEELKALFAAESIAMVQFCVVGSRTLLLVLDPRREAPQAFFADLGDNELKTMLPSMVSEDWNEVVKQALPRLSEKFMPILRDVVEHCDLLYLVPNSRLFFVPFAALTFDDGTPLAKHCALAYAPSAAILKHCFSRRARPKKRTCLAIGVGSEQGISFAEQAREITTLNWTDSKWLSKITREQFFDIVKDYTVLHLSCHSRIKEIFDVKDMLSASYIDFAGNQELTARDVFNFKGKLQEDLVFMNACMSGGFRLHLGSEVGGFWQGFLRAGATSLIAALFYVNPTSAQELALEFYRHWLEGDVTKAEALRRAQLHVYQKNDPLKWASHILIGDYR
ncbi:MAG: CHAT domain-containing protein [Theionarchaea archaeon]|nr:MAG: hypothetical protein AYK18_11735 [Theionarchaea archaeon DG-70]MBU7011608.1 CHAT domain-containing protein [Theionarchaea archaeon]